MAMDNNRHQQIRKEILENVDWKGLIYSSHEDKGEIHFSRLVDKKPIPLAQPDIIISKDDEILVIEIEKSNNPKHLLGVAFAIHSSNHGKFGKGKKNSFILKRKKISLLLVLDSEKVFQSGSGKPNQIKEIKSLIKKYLVEFKYFDIVTEDTVINAIKSWIEG